MSIKNWSHFLACGFGSGLSRIAPGTAGSIVALLIWYFFLRHFSLKEALAFNIVIFFIGVWLCGKTASDWQQKDPKSIVFDEFSGMWIALLPLQQNSNLALIIMAFLIFRIFDILKPWPIHVLEKKVPSGWGIMIDDVVAGLITGFLIIIISLLSIF